MNFLLDENLPLSFINDLTKLGFSVEHVINIGLRGKSDKEIAEYARQNQTIIITKDIKFGSLLMYPKGSNYGVIILRAPIRFKKEQLFQILQSFLISIPKADLIKSVVIVQVGRYRIRKGVF